MAVRFLSVCSGIEAASVALAPLGWKALAFSEIEPFPRAALKHHYPDVPLHGDFTELREQPWIVDADMLCGGTPCQAFSIAGLRQSLSDDRGNLTLEFIRLADAIDDLRRDAGRDAAWILWENVPGVLSTDDNAFGAFMGGLVGDDAPILPPNGRWTNAGVVAGPRRVAAWRVLDAQHFGLAQRRRRVFVLSREHPGGWACADALLPLIDSLSGHPAPRRETGEGLARPIAAGSPSSGGYRNDADTADNLIHVPDVSPALKARDFRGPSSDGDGDGDGAPLVVTPTVQAYRTAGDGAVYDEGDISAPLTTGTDPSASIIAFGSKEYAQDAGDVSPPLRAMGSSKDHPNGGGQVAIAYSIMPQNSGKDYKAREVDVAQPVMAAGPAGGNQGGDYIVQPMAFDLAQITSAANRTQVGPDRPASTLNAAGDMHVAFAVRTNQTGQNGPGYMEGIAPGLSADESPAAVAFAMRGREGGAMPEIGGDVSNALRTPGGGASVPMVAASAVRRLTPTECARLQGFPDDYLSQVQMRGKPAADGPMYKALGNSWAVPCVRYIGERIEAVRAASKTERAA